MLRAWIEWDLGQDSLIFTSQEKAIGWINRAIKNDETLSRQFPLGYVDLLGEGLCGLQTLTVDP